MEVKIFGGCRKEHFGPCDCDMKGIIPVAQQGFRPGAGTAD
jgi:hypothetical protein